MLSASIEKNVVVIKDFVLEEKGKLLKACSDMVILTEISKRRRLSALDIIALFKEKYGTQISPGTVYPILCRMERKRYAWSFSVMATYTSVQD
jgi:DNA-binding PadR family transcriptional regulator